MLMHSMNIISPNNKNECDVDQNKVHFKLKSQKLLINKHANVKNQIKHLAVEYLQRDFYELTPKMFSLVYRFIWKYFKRLSS